MNPQEDLMEPGMQLLTIPCKNPTIRQAIFDLLWKSLRGIRGYLASRFSLNKKNIDMREPKTMRQMTCGDFHGNVAPPNSSPSSNINVRASIERLPHQSIAFNPSFIDVLGLWTSRNIKSNMNVDPEIGKLIQKFHRQDAFSVNAPPKTGPIPPAIAHITSKRPR